MSSRYGRNQKRKARERIEFLEQELAITRYSLARSRARVEVLEANLSAWDEDIRRLLGEHSAFRRTAPRVQVRSVDEFQIVPLRDFYGEALRTAEPISLDDPLLPVEVMIERMHKLFAKVEERADTLRRYIRLYIKDGKEACMCLSPAVVEKGIGHQEADKLAKEIVEFFNSPECTGRPHSNLRGKS